MPEEIRLVIWDLDETFWKGTLAEGGISEYVQAHHDVVVTLAARGIPSSICSKNDFATVRSVLEARGIWEYFVFPSIDWSPKGSRLQALLDAVQLRPETVLFLDDHHGNRAEAAACVPGIQIGDETMIATLLADPRCAGKNDHELSRLRQYRVLEQRAHAKQATAGDNTEFLRNSRIVVAIHHDVSAHLDRAIELINRTNQLNFTKHRLSEDLVEARRELLAELDLFDTGAGLVSVKDRFGDYGFCGFFMLRGHWGARHLLHFVFSCRVLGMGVEQWVYQRLGTPALEVAGNVVSELQGDPDWINVQGDSASAQPGHGTPAAVRLRGPCELEVIDHFFRLDTPSVALEAVVWKDGFVLQRHHSALLHQSFVPRSTALSAALKPFGVIGDIESHFLDPCEDGTLLVYHNQADVHADLYRHKSLPLHLPMWFFGMGGIRELSNQDIDAYAHRHGLSESQAHRIVRIRNTLRTSFELVVEPSYATLAQMYRRLVARVPANALLVWVLPDEFSTDDNGASSRDDRQAVLNGHVREAASGAANLRVLDFSEAFPLESDRDRADDGHFVRAVYHRFYLKLCAVFDEWRASGSDEGPGRHRRGGLGYNFARGADRRTP